MGIFSSSVSITRYRVDGNIKKPILENVAFALKKNCIIEINDKSIDKSVGWSCFDNPFSTEFHRTSFSIGTNIVFSMRIDKKTIPNKMIKKEFITEVDKKLKEKKRNFLSKKEKSDIKDSVIHSLNLKVPATPNVYDILWQYEEKNLLFFSVLKNANEELESLFYKSFNMRLIKIFPLTMAQFESDLSGPEEDILIKLSPTRFTE